LSAVGWVGNTVPNDVPDHIVELPTSDVMNSGIVVGSALMNKRPIYVIRYQGFNWFNSAMITNYAGKSKEMWNKHCPMFIRSIAMEKGIGPVAGSTHASLYNRIPGIKIFSPMTSNEYQYVYDAFMRDNVPYYVSEHRGSYDNDKELEDVELPESDITLVPISITRFEAEKARIILTEQGYSVSILHQFVLSEDNNISCMFNDDFETISNSKYGALVLDDDYSNGLAKNIAYDIMMRTNKKAHIMGLENRTAGFHKDVDVLPPTCDAIVKKVKEIMKI